MTRARIPYSQAEMQWLEANRSMVLSCYHRAFCEAFGRCDVTAAHLHDLRKRRGWKVGRAPGRRRTRRLPVSGPELDWLQQNCTKPIADYHSGFCAEFSRTDLSAEQLQSLRKREGWRTGRSGDFEKGHVPHNKGKPHPAGRSPAAAKNHFKKGCRSPNARYLGHERISDHGYVLISVNETNPRTGFERRYVRKHRYLWEKANGPLPKGHCLKCLDGDKTNTDPSNWEAIPLALQARLNGSGRRPSYDKAPAELKPTIMAFAKLEYQLRERDKVRRLRKGT